jgi:hypothetical protein
MVPRSLGRNGKVQVSILLESGGCRTSGAPGHPPPKATPSPTSPFAPATGPYLIKNNLHWNAPKGSARHSGFDGTSWHYLAAWQISHRAAGNEDRPASFPDTLHHASVRQSSAYKALWGKNKPPPWLRLPPSTNPSSGRCGTLHCKTVGLDATCL